LKLTVLAALVALAVLVGCSNPSAGGEGPVLVRYVGGREYNDITGKDTAIVWKLVNGAIQPISIAEGDQYAHISALAESAGSLYAAGSVSNKDGTYIAAVWKVTNNGVTKTITPSGETWYAEIEALIESGGSLYAAGRVADDTTNEAVATVWKITNDVVTDTITLSGETGYTDANALIESGGSLYVVGDEGDNMSNEAVAWKITNDTVTDTIALTDGSRFAYANAIIESGDSFYVAGYEYDNMANNEVATVWGITNNTVVGTETISVPPAGGGNSGTFTGSILEMWE
jgi:hypothetical protein